MNLEFREISLQQEWDTFVKSQSRYSFVQSWAYTNVLKTLVQKVVRIGVYENNDLIGLLPLGIIRAKRGDYIRMRHGPILNERGWEIFSEISEYLSNFAKEQRVNFVRIQPTMDNSELLRSAGFNPAPTHNLDGEETLQLKLKDKTHNEIFQNMRKNTRYYIRKAEKEGVKVISDNDDFDNFYDLFKKTAERQQYTTWPKAYYQALFQEFKPGERNLYFAVHENKKIGLGLFVDYGKYRFYLEGGMLIEHAKKYPSYAVQGRSISDAVQKGIEVYDFWGGVTPRDENGQPVSNYPWAGIDLFKRGFGGEEVHMVHPHDLPLNWKYWLTYGFERWEKWRRGY